MDLLLSKVTTPVFGWIVQLLGWVIDGVYIVIDSIGIPNVGLSIIIYTIIVYMFLYPITRKQQKFSKMMSYMQPEINEINKKYMGKNDQESMYKRQEETNEVYRKYGVSPFGSCLPLLIQLPLLMALYQVIYHIPGYIERVANVFSQLATKIFSISGGTEAFVNFVNSNNVRITVGSALTKTNVIDGLSALTTNQWQLLAKVPEFSTISQSINETAAKSADINSFLGLNIAESPFESIKNAASSGMWWMIIIALLIPVLAWFTQWISFKLQPSAAQSGQAGESSMRAMNNFMPIFSAVLCLTFSVGIGLYWISGAVIRSVQMIYINRKMMKVDMAELIKKNQEKAAKKNKGKNKKDYVSESRVIEQARTKTKSYKGKYTNDTSQGYDYYEASKNADPNSIFAKANMVRKYDEEHLKDKKPKKK